MTAGRWPEIRERQIGQVLPLIDEDILFVFDCLLLGQFDGGRLIEEECFSIA